MKIKIDGVGTVKVDDSFKDLSVTEQNSYVETIKAQALSGQSSGDFNPIDSGEPEQREPFVPAEKQRGRTFAQGVTLGFADEIEAAARNPLSALGSMFGAEGKDYNDRLETIRSGLDDYRRENPREALAMELSGAILPTIGAGAFTFGTGGAAVAAGTGARLAPTLLRAAKIGALEGGVAGFGAGEGGFANRASTAATGAVLGGTVGAALPVAARGAGRVAKKVFEGSGLAGAKGAATSSDARVLSALEEQGLSPEEALQKLTEAKSVGADDVALADIGPRLGSLAQKAQSAPNEAREQIAERFASRRGEQADQISERLVSGSKTSDVPLGLNYVDDLAERTSAQAEPLYAKAYEKSLNAKPFQALAQRDAVQKAYKEALKIADADPNVDVRGLPSDIGSFFNKEMAQGNSVFMPTKVAHQVKKGLDAIIESQTDPLTGKITSEYGRTLVGLKRNWNDQIVKQNKDYGAANLAFGDKAKLKGAYSLGFDFMKQSEAALVKKVSKMSGPEKEALRIGLVSQVQELASKTGDTSNFVKTMFGSPKKRAALRLAFDSSDDFKDFEKFMTLQSQKFDTEGKIASASRKTDVEIDGSGSVDFSPAAGALGNLAFGNVKGAAANLAGGLARKVSGVSNLGAQEISEALSTADPKKQIELLNRLAELQRTNQKASSKRVNQPEYYSGVLGAGLGLETGYER